MSSADLRRTYSYYVPRTGISRYGNADLLWFLAPLENVIGPKGVKRKLMVGLRGAGAKVKHHVPREVKIPCHLLRCPIGWFL